MPSLLDEKLGYIFLHIPKTAGTSITTACENESLFARMPELRGVSFDIKSKRENRFSQDIHPDYWPVKPDKITGMKDSFDANNKADPNNRNWQILHARARDFQRALGPARYSDFTSFAIIRDPWDRLGSLYHYILAIPENVHYETAKTQGFEGFVRRHLEKTPSVQTTWLTDLDGNLIVNELLKFETLDADFTKASKAIFDRHVTLPKLNQSANTLARAPLSLSPSAIDLVHTVLADDFNVLGYDKTPPY